MFGNARKEWGLKNRAYTRKIDKKKQPATYRCYYLKKTPQKYLIGNIKILIASLMLSLAIKWWDVCSNIQTWMFWKLVKMHETNDALKSEWVEKLVKR